VSAGAAGHWAARRDEAQAYVMKLPSASRGMPVEAHEPGPCDDHHSMVARQGQRHADGRRRSGQLQRRAGRGHGDGLQRRSRRHDGRYVTLTRARASGVAGWGSVGSVSLLGHGFQCSVFCSSDCLSWPPDARSCPNALPLQRVPPTRSRQAREESQPCGPLVRRGGRPRWSQCARGRGHALEPEDVAPGTVAVWSASRRL
jgi:hypothetical protein